MRKQPFLILLLIVYLDTTAGRKRYVEIRNRDGAHHQPAPQNARPHGGQITIHPNHQPSYKGSGGGSHGGSDAGGGYGGQESGTKHHNVHKDVYHPHPEKCHPQTMTKFKTVYKDRKANIKNQIEILNPRPHIKKITETRYTTIRYPVILTQVLKPILTQIETKVKPIFKTKTINKYTTVLFTVTGIGQATITDIKYEKEYITRCLKKGGYGHHRRNDDTYLEDSYRISPSGPAVHQREYQQGVTVKPPPGIPYDPIYEGSENQAFVVPRPSNRQTVRRQDYKDIQPRNPTKQNPFLKEPVRNPSRQGVADQDENSVAYVGEIGDISDLYSQNVYYKSRRSSTSEEISREGRKLGGDKGGLVSKRESRSLEPTVLQKEPIVTLAHPPLNIVPMAIVVQQS